MPKILQFLRGNASSKPSLQDGQGYLEKDTSTFVIQNGTSELRLTDQSASISSLQSGLDATNGTVSTLSSNVATLNSDVSSLETQISGLQSLNKVTAQTGTSWTSSSGLFTQSISISGMTSDAVPLLVPQWSSNRTNEETVWNSLTGVQSGNGTITLTAKQSSTTRVSFVCYF